MRSISCYYYSITCHRGRIGTSCRRKKPACRMDCLFFSFDDYTRKYYCSDPDRYPMDKMKEKTGWWKSPSKGAQ